MLIPGIRTAIFRLASAHGEIQTGCQLYSHARDRDPRYRPRTGLPQGLRAGVQRGPGGGYVVHDQDRFAGQREPAPEECVLDVLVPRPAILADLWRSRTRTYQFSSWRADDEDPPELRGQQVGLVEAALPAARRVQRHRDHPWRGHALDDQALGEQLRERPRKSSPALVLEAVDRRLGRTFIDDRGAKTRQRRKAGAASTVTPGRIHLDTAAPAERLFQPADAGAASRTKPGPDGSAATASRRQQEIDHAHRTSVSAGSRGS